MKSKSVAIPEELFQMICDHFRIGPKYDLDIAPEDTNSDYYHREEQIKKMLEEKQNKFLIRNAYAKIKNAKTPDDKKKAYEFYKIVKSTFADKK